MGIFDIVKFGDKDKPKDQPIKTTQVKKAGGAQVSTVLKTSKPQLDQSKGPEYSKDELLLLEQVSGAIMAKISVQNVLTPITFPYKFDVTQNIRPGKSLKKEQCTIEPKIKSILESKIRKSVDSQVRALGVKEKINIGIKFEPGESLLKITIDIALS